MKDKIRKLIRKVRNVFTGETEKELSELAIMYFDAYDNITDLELSLHKLLLESMVKEPVLRSRERYS